VSYLALLTQISYN